MKFTAVRDFLAVAERGGLRAAARHLGMAQPAITRSIQDLEKELGVSLFERSAKGVRLTAMGHTFLRRANVVSSELQKAREEIDQLRGHAHGTVTACLSMVPHLALLPNALPAFRQRFPQVKLQLLDAVFPNIELPLIEGRADFYVGPVAGPVPRELHCDKLFDTRRVVVCRKGHPLAGAQSLSELVDAEWITTSITPKADDEFGPLFAAHGLPAPRLAIQAQSMQTCLVSLVHSDLLMMPPVQWARFPLWREVVQEIAVKEPLLAPPICIVQRNGLPLTPAAEYFCDMIRRAVAHMHAMA